MARRTIDVKQLTCDAIAQAMGKDYYPATGTDTNKNLAALDSYKLVDVGKDVEDAGKLDAFARAMLVMVGKITVDSRKLPLAVPKILKDTFEFGGYREHIRLGLFEVTDDEAWNLENGKSYADLEHTFHAPKTFAKIFEERKAINITRSETTDCLMEAFMDWSGMERYTTALATAWDNTLTQTINTWSHMLLSCAIVISDGATKTARHLLTEAKALGILGETATAADFMASDKAMIYAFEEIRNTRKFMAQDMSVAFNNKTIETFTPVDENNLVLLTQFASKIKSIKANTYNDNELGFGDFDEINSWQGIASTTETVTSYYNFDVTSSVKMSADASNKLGAGVEAYEQTAIVGLMWDNMGIGVCPEKRKTTSSYTACADFWNINGKYTANYWVDSSYNIVAFILD